MTYWVGSSIRRAARRVCGRTGPLQGTQCWFESSPTRFSRSSSVVSRPSNISWTLVRIQPPAFTPGSSGALKAGRALSCDRGRGFDSFPGDCLVPISQLSSPRQITDERTYLVRGQVEPLRVYSSMVEHSV